MRGSDGQSKNGGGKGWEIRLPIRALAWPLSPSAELSPGTMGVMPAARLVKKSLRKKRASCRDNGEVVRLSGVPTHCRGAEEVPRFPLTWSTLSRKGISETRRQHSGPPTLLVGATCSALMVSWGQRASAGLSAPPALLWHLPAPLPPGHVAHAAGLYHVGVRAPWHALAGVKVQEFVDLGGGQPVAHLKLLDDEDLA